MNELGITLLIFTSPVYIWILGVCAYLIVGYRRELKKEELQKRRA